MSGMRNIRTMVKVVDFDQDTSTLFLSGLPTKTLMNCKAVCKWWCKLISDRAFIKKQLKRSEPVFAFIHQAKYDSVLEDINYNSCILVQAGKEVKHNLFDFLPENVAVLATNNGLVCCLSPSNRSDPRILGSVTPLREVSELT